MRPAWDRLSRLKEYCLQRAALGRLGVDPAAGMDPVGLRALGVGPDACDWPWWALSQCARTAGPPASLVQAARVAAEWLPVGPACLRCAC